MAATRRGDAPGLESAEPFPGNDEAPGSAAPPATGSPRPTFDGPATIPYASVVRYLWGDDISGEVSERINASTDLIHMLVWALPPDGKCLHSDTHRAIFTRIAVTRIDPETGQVECSESVALVHTLAEAA